MISDNKYVTELTKPSIQTDQLRNNQRRYDKRFQETQ